MEVMFGNFKVAYDVVFRMRDLGGMGIHNLRLLNAALQVLVLAFLDRPTIQDRPWQGCRCMWRLMLRSCSRPRLYA